MARFRFAVLSLLLMFTSALIAVRTNSDAVTVQIQLYDSATKSPATGMIRLSIDGKPIALPKLVDRCRGMAKSETVRNWYAIPESGVEVALPPGDYSIEALSGLETELTKSQFVVENERRELRLPLKFLFRPADHGLTAGDTHLHLRDMTEAEVDAYLRTVPAADGLKVVYVSYLERHLADRTYITNRYPDWPLDKYRGRGVQFHHGEEYRHNFGAGGEGYGHVMFLNLKDRILPASVGPGITGGGFDDEPLRPGIDAARKQGATILWCHGTFGYEDVPNIVTGRVDALNFFDGSRRGTYEEVYYRCLNLGMRLPISTGTDWFIDDFSRDYVKIGAEVSPTAWLEGLKAGRALMTNGPLLTLTVDGREPGSVLELAGPRKLRIEATGVGRLDFTKLELVHNGTVIASVEAAAKDNGFHAVLRKEVAVDSPGWFAVRIASKTRNELGGELFAHTSPVYVDVGDRRPFVVEDALALLKLIEQARDEIPKQGKFSSPEKREELLAGYQEAAELLAKRIGERK